MLILIDNYDSFTYNLVHYFEEIGQMVKVFRNNEIAVDKVLKMEPKFIVISPGPSSPKNSGICLELIKRNANLPMPIPRLGVCLGHQAIAEAIGSTRVTITRLLGDLKDSGLLNIERKKITVFDPIALAKRFN